MRGLISMNFIDNGNITNEYPVVLYYNGDETNIISSIIDNEEISQFIYRKFINLDSYPKTVIYAVTYFADNDNEDTEEAVNKYKWTVEELHMLSQRADLKIKLLNDILIEISNIEGDCNTLIRMLMQNGLASSTIINYVRQKAQAYGFMKENVSELVKAVQEHINNL